MRLVSVSLDCADPQLLADFYRELVGGRQLWATESSVGLEVPGGVLVAQRVHPYVAPAWPGTSVVHLDFTSDDIDSAAARAVALGATLPRQPDPRWRVLLDPAGHPFCLTPFTPHTVG
jgi:catechol-2,3-dioxygenase